jgi:hypothetical protein
MSVQDDLCVRQRALSRQPRPTVNEQTARRLTISE